MVAVKVVAARSPASFFITRQILGQLGYVPQCDEDRIVLHLIRPFMDGRNRITKLSLTDGMDAKQQLRFFLVDRLRRRMSWLSRQLVKRYKLHEVVVENAVMLDGESRFFIDILRDVGGVTVALRAKIDGKPVQIDLDCAETELVKTLGKRANMPAILAAAETYLSVGNYWAVRRVLDAAPEQEQSQSPHIARIRAISYVQSNDPILAQRYYEIWRTLGGPADLVSANYGLAMLYLRHHQGIWRDRCRAEALLEEAFQTTLKHDVNPFLRIFNRNGFALILFRKGEIDEAISLLQWAVKALKKIPSKKALMHTSVIIYNIAQCYAAKGMRGKAIEQLNALLEIDPYYPEYHMELAANYMADEHYDLACQCLDAALAVDRSIVEAYAQKGFCQMHMKRFAKGYKSYMQAYRLAPHDANFLYGAAYCLAIDKRYREIIALVQKPLHVMAPGEIRDDVLTVYAEALSFEKTPQAAARAVLAITRNEECSDAVRHLIAALQSHCDSTGKKNLTC